jgi:hypothetical protein
MRALVDQRNESPKPGDPVFAGSEVMLAARPADALRAAEEAILAAGYECVFIGDRVEGEAREVAAEHARIVRELRASGRRAVVLSGGELTVTIRGKGRGGPNQEYATARRRSPPSPPTPTEPTVAPALPSTPPAHWSMADRLRARKRTASIPPPFSQTTTQVHFLRRLETYWQRGRLSPTLMTSVPSSLTDRSGSRQNPRIIRKPRQK